MLYCETCREKHHWAWTRRSEGHCDICGVEGTCYCYDADAQRIHKHVRLTSALEWAERIAKRIGERCENKPLPVAETHLLMAHTIMDIQLEALALRRNPDFLQTIYEHESMDELRLEICKLREQIADEQEHRANLEKQHRIDRLDRAWRHWRAACAVVDLVRSLARLGYDNLDDASVRFSLLELK
jgi:hypothetical protein